MHLITRLITLMLVALVISPAVAPVALAEPEILLAGPELISPRPGQQVTGNPEEDPDDWLVSEPLGIPTFRWDDIGASKYELEVATSESFGASVVLRRSALQHPLYTPTGFDEIGSGLSLTEDPTSHDFARAATFYWHVRAYDDAQEQWGDYSPTQRFVRYWGYRPENLREGAEEYQTPEGVSSVQPFTPYFEWDPVPGASFYQIQVDTSNSFGSPYINAKTDETRYTPTSTLQNDDDLFWRVRAFHRPNSGSFTGGRGGEWSEVRQFKLAWGSQTEHGDRRPLLLTPPNGANYLHRPLFCWQPVEGANKYRIDVASNNEFVSGSYVVRDKTTEATCYSFPRDGTYTLEYDTEYWWRVEALDASGYLGQATDEGITSAPFQFRTAPAEIPVVPDLIYPPYWYPPVRVDEPDLRTFEDRTIAVPTFVWDNVDGASYYELCIDDVPYMDCTSDDAIVVRTDNASYTFTDTSVFDPIPGQGYYWKVRAEPGLSFDDLNTRWLTRIDTSLLTGTAAGDTPEPLLPTYGAQPWTGGDAYGEESVTYYPVFAWRPVAETGAARYQVQIARTADFATEQIVHDGETMYSEYTPVERPEPGTYFWRVRRVAPETSGWSGPGRFIVSRSLTYAHPPMDGSHDDWEAAGFGKYEPTDESGDAAPDHDLIDMHIVITGTHTLIGVPVGTGTTLGLYLDTDHVDGRGAPSPPSGRHGPVLPDAHLPEYAFYWKIGDAGDLGRGEVWKWLGATWQKLGTLGNILSSMQYDAASSFLKVTLSSSQIDQPGSLSLLLFTLNDSGEVQDLLPSLPGEASTAAFHTESSAPTPILPTNSLAVGEDVPYWSLTQIERNTPVLMWRHNNAPSDDGFRSALFFQTFKDDTFTALYESENGNSPSFSSSKPRFWYANSYWAPQVHYSDNNSYNWRISRSGFGPSAPHRFTKLGYIPTKLAVTPVHPRGDITGTHMTPSFTWQATQSAPKYLWELYEGGTRRAYQETMVPYFTPRSGLKDGVYTWKVWAKDARGRLTSQAAEGQFTKQSLRVEAEDVRETMSDGVLELGWKPVTGTVYYKVTIASDQNMSRNVSSYNTHGTTFTPESVPKAVSSGGEVWWRVVICDNENNVGQYLMEPRFLPRAAPVAPVGVLNLPLVLAP